jgi:hypothetical protein
MINEDYYEIKELLEYMCENVEKSLLELEQSNKLLSKVDIEKADSVFVAVNDDHNKDDSDSNYEDIVDDDNEEEFDENDDDVEEYEDIEDDDENYEDLEDTIENVESIQTKKEDIDKKTENINKVFMIIAITIKNNFNFEFI